MVFLVCWLTERVGNLLPELCQAHQVTDGIAPSQDGFLLDVSAVFFSEITDKKEIIIYRECRYTLIFYSHIMRPEMLLTDESEIFLG